MIIANFMCGGKELAAFLPEILEQKAKNQCVDKLFVTVQSAAIPRIIIHKVRSS